MNATRAERWRAWRPHLVAALVTLHIVASCVAAIPSPGIAFDRRTWKDPRARRELALWAERLGVERDVLEDRLYAVARTVVTTQHALQTPFRPWRELTGLTQSWPMFVAGTPHADLFEVRGRASGTGDAWRTLYARGHEDAQLLASALESPRVRTATFEAGWQSFEKTRARVCGAIARAAFASDARLDEVECSYLRTVNRAPGAPDVERSWTRTREVVITRADVAAPQVAQ